jgi:hypothetical protein
MNRQIPIIILAAFYLLMLGAFTACSMDEIQKGQTSEPPKPVQGSPISVKLTRAGGQGVDITNRDDSVARARMIIVDAFGKVLVNDYKPDAVIQTIVPDVTTSPPKKLIHIIFRDSVPVGQASIFTVTNEYIGWNLGAYTVGSTINVNDLKQKVRTFSDYPNVDMGSPIPMAGIYENVYIKDSTVYKNSSLTDTVYAGDIERLYAKVTLELECHFADLVASNGGAPIEVQSVGIRRMPAHSYLAPLQYTLSSDFTNGSLYTYSNQVPQPSHTFNYITNIPTPATGEFKTAKITFYIPEYYLVDTAMYTYISVLTNLVGNTTAVVPYRIVVGDGIDPDRNGVSGHDNAWLLNPSSPGRGVKDLRIQRNTHYQFLAHIKGFNISGDQVIEIHPRVLHWDEVGTLDGVDEVDYQLILSQDEFYTPLSPVIYNGVVNITTDYSKGWKVIARSGNVTVTPAVGTYSASGKLSFTYSDSGHSVAVITVATGPNDKIKKEIYINKP